MWFLTVSTGLYTPRRPDYSETAFDTSDAYMDAYMDDKSDDYYDENVRPCHSFAKRIVNYFLYID